MRWHPGEEGASEVVGVMLLVGVTVLAVAVVAAIFLSGSQPGEIPHAAIIAGNESVAGSENRRLILAHEGGDPLRTGEYRIYIDTGDGLVDKTGDFTKPKGGVWSIGESISYDVDTTALKRVVVTVLSGGSETILSMPTFVGGGSKFSPDLMEPNGPDETEGEPKKFIDFVINESVFVYGNILNLGESGSRVVVTGSGATIVITGRLDEKDLKGNSFINVSNIYIDGDVILNKTGSNRLGSPTNPGNITINGDLMLMEGNMNIYGKVYVNGDCDLGGVTIYDKMYVNGNLTLRKNPINFEDDAHVYYTGITRILEGDDENKGKKLENNCTRQINVPMLTMPNLETPSVRSDENWYENNGYAPRGDLRSNLKIFAPSYNSITWGDTANNVIIIARTGNITITGMGDNGVTGIFFAPNGKVTFGGKFLEGVVIARDGFFVERGDTEVTFKNVEEYISNRADYPF